MSLSRRTFLAAAAVPLFMPRFHLSAEEPAFKPFKIHVDDAVLADLKERLAKTRWPDALPDTGWTYGADLKYMQELCEYWRTRFDWREQERRLNKFEQFTTPIDGVELHFIHVRSKHAHVLPLVLSHDCPGSVAEFHKAFLLGPGSSAAWARQWYTGPKCPAAATLPHWNNRNFWPKMCGSTFATCGRKEKRNETRL